MKLVNTLWAYKWATLLIVVAVFLFYWYELRPVSLARACATNASADARSLLKSKADIAKGSDKEAQYRQLIDKNMYLRSDYESFLNKCLIHYGMIPDSMMKQNDDQTADTNGAQ